MCLHRLQLAVCLDGSDFQFVAVLPVVVYPLSLRAAAGRVLCIFHGAECADISFLRPVQNTRVFIAGFSPQYNF